MSDMTEAEIRAIGGTIFGIDLLLDGHLIRFAKEVLAARSTPKQGEVCACGISKDACRVTRCCDASPSVDPAPPVCCQDFGNCSERCVPRANYWQAQAQSYQSAPQQVEPGLVSVNERMPEPGTECLVFGASAWAKKPYFRIDTWDEQHEAPVSWSSATIPIGFGWGDAEFEEITHWMPLPPAPKEPKP